LARTSSSTILPRATVQLITESRRPSNVRERIPAINSPVKPLFENLAHSK